jgi:ATP-dependent Clp protease adaptor protein ClpS
MADRFFGRPASHAMQASGATEVVAPPTGAPAIEDAPAKKTAPRRRTKPKKQSPYAVILHNDDLNGFDFVVGVLRKVFHYERPKAYQLTMAAHTAGRSIVWSGVLEVAELKADQIRSCGPDPSAKVKGALALRVTVEPLPG